MTTFTGWVLTVFLALAGLLVVLIVIAGSFRYGARLKTMTGRVGQWATGRVVFSVGLYLFSLLVIHQLHPSLWEWWHGLGPFFFWTTLVCLGIVLGLLATHRPKASLGVVGITLALLLLAYPLKEPAREVWREIGKSAADLESRPTTRGAVNTSGESEMVTITAPTKDWSRNVSIPMKATGRISPQGRVLVKTLSGDQWEDGPHQMRPPRRRDSMWDRTFAFQSLEDKPVEVIVEWTH